MVWQSLGWVPCMGSWWGRRKVCDDVGVCDGWLLATVCSGFTDTGFTYSVYGYSWLKSVIFSDGFGATIRGQVPGCS